MLTPKQAAEQIGVSTSLIYQWCQEGLIECFRFGGKNKRGKLMIEPTALDRFVESCRQPVRVAATLRHIQL